MGVEGTPVPTPSASAPASAPAPVSEQQASQAPAPGAAPAAAPAAAPPAPTVLAAPVEESGAPTGVEPFPPAPQSSPMGEQEPPIAGSPVTAEMVRGML